MHSANGIKSHELLQFTADKLAPRAVTTDKISMFSDTQTGYFAKIIMRKMFLLNILELSVYKSIFIEQKMFKILILKIP